MHENNNQPAPIRFIAQTSNQSLVVLLIQPDDADVSLVGALCSYGYHVSVTSSVDAIEKLEDLKPDIVVIDYALSEPGVIQLGRDVKQSKNGGVTPLLYVSCTTDDALLGRCFEVGAFDVVTKPLSGSTLQAKMECARRQLDLSRQLISQRDRLLEKDANAMREQLVAKRVFEKVVQSGCLAESDIKCRLSPISLFNGDILLAAPRRTSGIVVVVGDFTGHGLSAALGAIPVAEVFYAMVNKGFGISEIAAETNKKLKSHLPVGRFLAAAILELDVETGTLAVWNGGIPGLFLRRDEASEPLMHIESEHIPLGVLPESAFDKSIQVFKVNKQSAVFACTDGLLESKSPQDEMYGAERMQAVLSQIDDPQDYMSAVLNDVRQFNGKVAQTDDATMMLLPCDCAIKPARVASFYSHKDVVARESGYSINIRLEKASIRDTELSELVSAVLHQFEYDEETRRDMRLVLKELIANAIQHGVLELDSKIKQTPTGFQEYYESLENGLKNLSEGFVSVSVQSSCSGHAVINVQDSGRRLSAEKFGDLEDLASYHGRGLALLKEVCSHVEYDGATKSIIAHIGEDNNPT